MRTATSRIISPLALAMVILTGCTGIVMDVDTLRAEGYQRINVIEITPSGSRRDVELYEVWVKESREAGRNIRACLVPKVEGAGYKWLLKVFVDDKEAWSYETGPMTRHMGQASLRRGIDCIVSAPLPEGRVNFEVGYAYWQ